MDEHLEKVASEQAHAASQKHEVDQKIKKTNWNFTRCTTRIKEIYIRTQRIRN